MQELLAINPRQKSGATGEVLLDIDFSKQVVGDVNVIDQTGKGTFTKTGTGVAKVEDDPYGRCFNFSSGASLFTAGRVIDLSTVAVEIRLTAKVTSAGGTANKMAWCTGDYPSAFVAGICQYNVIASGSSPPQLFVVDGSRNYSRLPTGETYDAINEFIITTDPVKREITIEELAHGKKTVQKPTDWFGPGTNFSFGGSYVGGVNYAPYLGKIWKLKIQKMR